jgi:hypothetical protein
MKENDSEDLQDDKEIIDNEIIDNDSKRFELYSNILDKDNNISIHFRRPRRLIKLSSNVSLFRICSLCQTVPEENVLYSLYADVNAEESDEEDENQDQNKKGIDKLKERLHEGSFDNTSLMRRSTKLKQRRSKKNLDNLKAKDKENEEEGDSVLIIDDIKSSINNDLNLEGYTIGNNHEFYKGAWRNLYKFLLVFAFVILLGLAYFIFKESYDYSMAEFISFGLIIIICITSMRGNAKMLSRKKVNFKLENILLVLIILVGVYILGCTYTNKFGMVANQFLSQYYAFVYFVFILLIAFCFLLIFLNIKMVEFYRAYSKKINGTSLIDKE